MQTMNNQIYGAQQTVSCSQGIQPFFVTSTEHYTKKIVMKHGIAHFYDYIQNVDRRVDTIAVPDGCVDILFEKTENGMHGRVAGSVLEKYVLNNIDNREYFGIRFLPGEIPAILNVAASDLIQSEIDFEDAIGDKELVKRLSSADNAEMWLRIFLESYERVLTKPSLSEHFVSGTELAGYIKKQILQSGGSVTMQELAEDTGYSTRYILRTFSENYGMSPKVFAKIIKFQNTIQRINHGTKTSLTDLSMDMGYYDQAHFDKEFKKYAAMTPKKYKKLITDMDYSHRMEVESI